MSARETVLARPAAYWTGQILGVIGALYLALRVVVNTPPIHVDFPRVLVAEVVSDRFYWTDPALSALGLIFGIAAVVQAALLRRGGHARAGRVAWVGVIIQVVAFATLSLIPRTF